MGVSFTEYCLYLRSQHSLSLGVFEIPNSFQDTSTVTTVHKMLHELSTVFLTYGWRGGVMDDPGHLPNHNSFVNVHGYVAGV